MCLSPLHIRNKSVYQFYGLSYTGYDVPCGHCLECNQIRKNDWQTRIAFELSSLYKRHGRAVFLTFTYNNSCLPHFTLNFGHGEKYRIEVFRHKDVLSFLNRLKVEANKRFGKGSYKYFFTSEYGKNTKRPHYHAIFFLQPQVDWHTFVEICRSKWSYGFMFPKYDKRRRCYIDKHNQPITDGKPCISSLGGCSKYVSKYVTKDLSFYEIPMVSLYLENKRNKEFMKTCLPKHWQSNLLGISALDEVQLMDENSFKEAISNGIVNPLTFKYVPLPQFIINKLMYNNVKSDRISKTTDKPLYDRYLSDFGRYYFYDVFVNRVLKTAQKMSIIFQSHGTSIPDSRPFSNGSRSLSQLGVSDVCDFRQFVPFAIYRILYRYLPSISISRILSCYGGDISALFDFDTAFSFWIDNKDTSYLRHKSLHNNPFDKDYQLYRFDKFWLPYEMVCKSFEYFSRSDAKSRLEENQRKMDEYLFYRSLYKNQFDNSLC